MTPSRVAVTGASGFIGRHVVAALAQHGVREPVLMQQPGTNLPDALAGHAAVEIDIAAPPADAWERLGRPDVLIHLAWGGLPNYRSLHHFETELPAHFRFLKQLVAAGLPALVATGTCFEYGMQSGALSEDGTEPRPDNPYGHAKDALRRQLGFLRRERPFAFTWARLFYLWGEGQAPSSIYPQLCRAAAAGDAEFPMSGGEQLRDYLPVEEVARHLAAFALARADLGPVNVCSGVPVSVRALVERWIAEHGWAIRPRLGRYPYPDYEPMAFWGDATKLATFVEATA